MKPIVAPSDSDIILDQPQPPTPIVEHPQSLSTPFPSLPSTPVCFAHQPHTPLSPLTPLPQTPQTPTPIISLPRSCNASHHLNPALLQESR